MKGSNTALKQRICALAIATILGCVATVANANVLFPKVTNTNNSGSGSLRQAIIDANNNGADGAIVGFQIGSTCGPHIIHVATQLPDPQFEIHFEGYTQPGASPNTKDIYAGNDAVICIVLAGDNLVTDGLAVASSVADSMTLSVQGIAFSGFTHSALNLRGGSGHLVAGIRTGGTIGGFAMEPNLYGVILAAGVHDAIIGGSSDNADFNQFGDITNNAIYISSNNGSSPAAHDNDVNGNKIGFVLDADNNKTSLPTGGAGIAVGGYGNLFFNDDIENAGASGIHISNTDAHNNDVALGAIYKSVDNGVLIDDDAHDNDIDNVQINSNGGAAIRVVTGQGNSFEYNIMSNNVGLGIDLADEGVTPDDNDSMQPTPDYANRGQNFPTITSAAGGHYSGTISGTLTTTPGTYQIALYVADTCIGGYGEGFAELDYRNNVTGKITVPNITAQGQGSTSFSLPVSFFFFDPGDPLFITSTATDSSNNTSEFSSCVEYTDDTVFLDGFEGSPT